MTCNKSVRLARLHLRRGLCSGTFWACLALALVMYFFTCLGFSFQWIQRYMARWEYSETLIFFTTAPWVSFFAHDLKDRTTLMQSMRSGVRGYMRGAALAALAGIAVSSVAIQLGIMLIANMKVLSGGGPLDISYLRFTFLGNLLDGRHMALYVAAQVLRKTLVCEFFGAMGLWVSLRCRNVLMTRLLPMALYYVMLYLFLMIPSLPQSFAPDYLIASSAVVAEGTWAGIWVVCGYTVPGTALFMALFCREGRKKVYHA